MKKNPIGIRFNQEKLDFVRQKYPELKTPQQVVNFLLNAFWWQHHAAVFQNGMARVPAGSPIANMLDREALEETRSITYQIPEGSPLSEDWVATGQGIAVTDEPPTPEMQKAIKEFNKSIEQEIADLLAAKVPKERDTPLGRKAWNAERRQRIETLKAQKL